MYNFVSYFYPSTNLYPNLSKRLQFPQEAFFSKASVFYWMIEDGDDDNFWKQTKKSASKTLTFAASNDGDVSGSWTDVENDGPLHPWNEEVGAFSSHLIFDTSKSVENYGSVSSIHCKK